MALVDKREDLIHVPWSSVEEWLQVYKQIFYSDDTSEQNKAYETLLLWKARKPQLSVGVECTLGLIQVSLRDREWTPKILSGEISTSYENDLRLLYSTVIMKFLNHISNIAYDKQTSLFVTAKQLNIPEWIVDLRHNIAHGNELPSLDLMRIVTKILLTWLHEEYWAAAANKFQDPHILNFECDGNECDKLIDLIELWTAVGLYMKTDYAQLSDIPDAEMKNTLKSILGDPHDSNLNNEDTELLVLSYSLLSEISKNFNKIDSSSKRDKLVIDTIIKNYAFLPNLEILSIFVENQTGQIEHSLPLSLIDFWKDILIILQEKKILLPLFLHLIDFLKKENDDKKKLLASLWVKAIAQAFYKLLISRNVYRSLEQKLNHEKVKVNSKSFLKNVSKEVENLYPELKNVLTLNIDGEFPNCLTDKTLVKRLVHYYNEYSNHYIPEILKISALLDKESEEKLLTLMNIYFSKEKDENVSIENSKHNKVYTVEDLLELEKKEKALKKSDSQVEITSNKIYHTDLKIASNKYDWSACPLGILPWQIEDFDQNDFVVSSSAVCYPNIKNLNLSKTIDFKKLKLHNKVQWENLIKKKKKTKSKTKLVK